MHEALQIPEVLDLIFSFFPVRQDRLSRSGGAELATLARTCRGFKEAALNRLWYELPSLDPFVYCLPKRSHTWDPKTFLHVDTSVSGLTEVEWDALREYGRRVHIIHGISYGPPSPHPILNPPFSEPTLLPAVKSLELGGVEIAPAIHVATPALTALTFDARHHGDNLLLPSPFFSDITAMGLTPNIVHFRFAAITDYPFYHASCIDSSIRGWSHLSVVDCLKITLSSTTIVHLSDLPSLSELSFTVGEETISDPLPDTLLTFPKMEYLRVQAVSLDYLTQLFFRIQLLKVQVLEVWGTAGYQSGQTVRSFMAVMEEKCLADSLTRFYLHCTSEVNSPALGNPTCTIDDLVHLKSFNRLHAITVNLQWSQNPGNGIWDSEGWLSHWPELEDLTVNDHCIVYKGDVVS